MVLWTSSSKIIISVVSMETTIVRFSITAVVGWQSDLWWTCDMDRVFGIWHPDLGAAWRWRNAQWTWLGPTPFWLCRNGCGFCTPLLLSRGLKSGMANQFSQRTRMTGLSNAMALDIGGIWQSLSALLCVVKGQVTGLLLNVHCHADHPYTI